MGHILKGNSCTALLECGWPILAAAEFEGEGDSKKEILASTFHMMPPHGRQADQTVASRSCKKAKDNCCHVCSDVLAVQVSKLYTMAIIVSSKNSP